MDDRVNYIEYFLFATPAPASNNAWYASNNAWYTDIGEAKFKAVINRLSRHSDSLKFNQREFKEICYGDIIFQNYNNEEHKVFKLVPISTRFENKRLVVEYQKQKLSLVNVPSTANVDNVSYVRQLIFRVSNRLFLNCQVKKEPSHTSHTIFVNYNHDHNMDMNIIEKQLASLFKKAEGATC